MTKTDYPGFLVNPAQPFYYVAFMYYSHKVNCCALIVHLLPFNEVIDEVFDLLLHLRSLERDWITLVSDFEDQLTQFVQLSFNLEKTLGCQGKPVKVISHKN